MLRLFFRNAIPTTFDREKISAPQTAIRDSRTYMPGWLVLVGFFTLEPLGVTVNPVAALANRHFLLGMYLVVCGLRNAGLTGYLSALFNVFAQYGSWGATLRQTC